MTGGSTSSFFFKDTNLQEIAKQSDLSDKLMELYSRTSCIEPQDAKRNWVLGDQLIIEPSPPFELVTTKSFSSDSSVLS